MSKRKGKSPAVVERELTTEEAIAILQRATALTFLRSVANLIRLLAEANPRVSDDVVHQIIGGATLESVDEVAFVHGVSAGTVEGPWREAGMPWPDDTNR